MEDHEFNPFAEKLNVGLAIQGIGPNKEIKLIFDQNGQFIISSKNNNYFPTGQGPLKTWDYETILTLKKEDCGDWDWPKYAAEDMLSEIVDQMKKNGLKLL